MANKKPLPVDPTLKKALRLLMPVVAAVVVPALRAVYAPIPEAERGQHVVVSLDTAVTYDNNIFGAPEGGTGSLVYEVVPDIKFNATPTAQTFVSGEYQLQADYFENRPGSKLVYSHMIDGRVAHAFSKVTNIDVDNSLSISHNPASLLNGVSVNGDQSALTDEFNARLTTALAEDTGLVLKARVADYDYLNAALGDSLNRYEDLFGAEFSHAVSGSLRAAAEVRHEDVGYVHSGGSNNKTSQFAMGGFDYSPDPKLSVTARLGAEWRHRADGTSATAPYAELTGRLEYGRQSYISAGYIYTLSEASDPTAYHDEAVNRLFATVQHALTARLVLSASADYEPSRLNGRAGLAVPVADVTETGTHAGVAATYMAGRWRLSATYDYDYTDSQVFTRGMNRSRTGLRASVTF